MNHPTKKQMQTVIDNLKKIEDQANQIDAFDINNGLVRIDEHQCGTVHCVAGWYAVSIMDTDEDIKDAIDNNDCSYTRGADKMAWVLGFKRKIQLECWAYENNVIWGNVSGAFMFLKESAYNGLSKRTDKMSCVIEHLEGVRDRLPC